MKNTQAYVSVWGLLMASQEVLSLMGVKGSSHPLLVFSDEDLPPEGATHTKPLQITIECMGAKVPMVLIDNGFALNVCPFRTDLTVGIW